MPERLRPAFIAGLQAVAKSRRGGSMNARLQLPLVTKVLRACTTVNRGQLDPLIAYLHRLEAEAARDEARDFRGAVAPAMRGSESSRDPFTRTLIPPQPARAVALEKTLSPPKSDDFTIGLAPVEEKFRAARALPGLQRMVTWVWLKVSPPRMRPARSA